MKNRYMKLVCALSVATVAAWSSTAGAAIINYNLEWEGLNEYSATGMFSYDDASAAGDNLIDKSELTDLMLTVFDPTLLALGTFDLSNQSSLWSFNFQPIDGEGCLAFRLFDLVEDQREFSLQA